MCRREQHYYGKRLGQSLFTLLFCYDGACRANALQVPAISTPTSNPSIYTLSANMKRIDLISKLVAPAVVSTMQTWTASASTVAVILAVQNIASFGPEWFAVQSVWNNCPNLRRDRSTGHIRGHIPIWDPHQFVEDFRLYFSCDVWIRR